MNSRPRLARALVYPPTPQRGSYCLRTGLLAARARRYATNDSWSGDKASATSRRHVTVANDDGRVAWTDLNAREKAARTTQQSLNLFIILAGLVMTGGVFTFLYLDVFSSSSKTAHFNRAVARVSADPRCLDLLGDRKSIRAYGEPTWNKWTRNRHIATRLEKDRTGREHFYMHFYVEGNANKGNPGTVQVHMSKKGQESETRWDLLALDVPGHQRVVLEGGDQGHDRRAQGKMFGVKWW